MHRIKNAIRFYTIVFFLLFIPGMLCAGSHPLAKYEAGFFDLVVTLDWNPTQAEKDGLLKTAFEEFGRDVFTMSEGKHKIRKIYVFTNNAQMNKADIRFLNKGGRSNANISGLQNAGGRILTYTGFSSGRARSASFIGQTMAHEFGHYVYAVFDEYQGSAASATRQSTPLSGDTARDTIMCCQGSFQWLSTAADYADAEDRKTGQWRVFNSSAWETLVRDPKDDKLPETFNLGNDRVRYGEFKGLAAPKTLTKPTAGWDSQFQVVYKGGNVAVLVIDKTASMANGTPSRIDAAKSAAKQFIDLMKTGDYVSVVVFDVTAATLTGVTQLTDQAAKDAVKNQIDGITAGGKTNYTAALDQAWSLINVPAYENYSRFVVFLSDGGCDTGTCPPSVANFTSKEIPIYTVGLGSDIVQDQLRGMAKDTGGAYYESPASADLAQIYAAVNRDLNGTDSVMGEQAGILAVGRKNESSTPLTGKESSVTFRASWTPGDTMTYVLVDPQGNTIDPGSLPAGVTYQSGGDYGIYRVANPAAGTWTSRATATAATAGGAVKQEISSESPLTVNVKLSGGAYPEPIGILVTLAGPEPIAGAKVTASIGVPPGAAPIPDIVLEDDEDGPDDGANDGVYTGILANYAANGTYTITIKATNPDGTAYLTTRGALEAGDDAAIELLPPFQAMTSANITVTAYGPMPGTPQAAVTIPTDNTRIWGTIQNNSDAVWYKFPAVAGARYFIQTGNLVSTDGSVMATVVTLYQPDAATVIASSAQYNGGNISYLDWTAPADGTYFLKVEHASPGTGTFALTTGQTSIYQAGGSGSSSRCFIATAAYGSFLHPYVRVLKMFRNKFLLTSRAGCSFVAWYYRQSPPIADAIRESPVMKAGIRILLLPLIGLSYLCLKTGLLPGFLLIILAVILAYGGIRKLVREKEIRKEIPREILTRFPEQK